MRTVLGCAVVVSLVCVSGCMAPTPLPTSGPSPSSSRYDGTWEGTTAEGRLVGFVIELGRIRSFLITLNDVHGEGCVFGDEGLEIAGSGNFDLLHGSTPIVKDAFTIVSQGSWTGPEEPTSVLGSVSFSLTGTFTDSSAQGRGDFHFSGPGCSADTTLGWLVTRQTQ